MSSGAIGTCVGPQNKQLFTGVVEVEPFAFWPFRRGLRRLLECGARLDRRPVNRLAGQQVLNRDDLQPRVLAPR